MKGSDRMRYKIGDVARILGVSTDILRYYERKGVVTPEKDENNDYRYYDAWHINFLMDCLWFKNFGFSIEQIADMVHSPNAGELAGLFERKEDELRAQIRRAELLLRRSAQHRADLETIDRLLYKCEISESPALVRFIDRIGRNYMTDAVTNETAKRWLEALPFNHRYFEMPGDALMPGVEEDYRWGYCLSEEYVAELGFEVRPPMIRLPSRRSIHTVFKNSGGKDGFSPSLLQYTLDFARENGIAVFGPIHGVLLCSVEEEAGLTGYFEAWIPIE